MNVYPSVQLALALGCALALVSLASAATLRAGQLETVVDEGRIVYVNSNPRVAVHGKRAPFEPWHYRSRSSALPFDDIVRDSANRWQIDPELVHAIIQVESNYNPRARSPKGAMGLMQLIPATAGRYGVSDPFDIQQNISAGVNHLRYLLDRFEGDIPQSIAAYNAGENAVVRAGGIPPIDETRDYVRRVTNLYGSANRTWPAVKGESERTGFSPNQPGTVIGTSQIATPTILLHRYTDSSGVVHFEN
jgi:hypothetical protein